MPRSLRLLRLSMDASDAPPGAATTPPAGPSATVRASDPPKPRPTQQTPAAIWLAIGVIAWGAVAALGLSLAAATPSRAGFDLELVLRAGRRVAEGASPYEPNMLAGSVPSAVDLFYSYPPPVAQYFALFAAVPSALILIALAAAAAIGFAAVAMGLAGVVGRSPARPWRVRLRSVGLPALALVPAVLPFAIAVVFGNLDLLFPLLYGLMLLAAIVPSRSARFGGGAALAVAGLTKVHPFAMGIWFAVRSVRDRARRPDQPAGWIVLGSACAVVVVIVALSLVVGGAGPWSDYLTVLRTASASAVVGGSNIGPAAQIALLAGAGDDVARLLQLVVTAAAVLVIVAAAWARDDSVESFGWATVASLVVLPVTWIHYPVALLPIAAAACLRVAPARRREVIAELVGAGLVAVFAVALPVLIWASVVLVLVAVRRSSPVALSELPFPTLEPSRVSRFPISGSRV